MSAASKSPETLHLPFVVTPGFSRRLGETARHMTFADAVVDTLEDSGIAIEFEGDTPPDEGGLLVASDHSQKIEPLLVQAAMAEAGREGSHVIAMPISFAGRLMQDSGEKGKGFVIPVMPSSSSDQYQPSIRDDPRGLYRKLRFPHIHNQPPEVLKQINNQSLAFAADQLSNGQAVTIFPTGGPIDGTWRRGLGEIAYRLPDSDRNKTEISLLQVEPFSLRKVAGALALREVGIRPRKQTLILRGYTPGTVAELQPSHDNSQTYSSDFTEIVRKIYQNHYSK